MPTTTSLHAFAAQGLRVAASFNGPITSGPDHIRMRTAKGAKSGVRLPLETRENAELGQGYCRRFSISF